MEGNIKTIRRRHGMALSRPYRIWCGIKRRVYDKEYAAYKNYGGRGITLSKSWETFEGFWADMKSTYAAGLTIDRTNNDKGYSKQNCRWVTHSQQQRNRRDSRILTYKGSSRPMAEWADVLGIRRVTLSSRINQLGWSAEKALSTKVRNKNG